MFPSVVGIQLYPSIYSLLLTCARVLSEPFRLSRPTSILIAAKLSYAPVRLLGVNIMMMICWRRIFYMDEREQLHQRYVGCVVELSALSRPAACICANLQMTKTVTDRFSFLKYPRRCSVFEFVGQCTLFSALWAAFSSVLMDVRDGGFDHSADFQL